MSCCHLKISQKNLGQVIINIKTEKVGDQTNNESKLGTGQNFSSKKDLIFDKRNFVRMKNDNIFDEYEIKEKLGEGAYGCVYKVQQKSTHFLRAVKALKKDNIDYNEFNNEMELLKALDHPNIIKLFDCYQDRRYYYMVEEYCSGGDLFDYIQKERFFTEKKQA